MLHVHEEYIVLTFEIILPDDDLGARKQLKFRSAIPLV